MSQPAGGALKACSLPGGLVACPPSIFVSKTGAGKYTFNVFEAVSDLNFGNIFSDLINFYRIYLAADRKLPKVARKCDSLSEKREKHYHLVCELKWCLGQIGRLL